MEVADLERWNRIQHMFDHAMDLPAAQWAAYLDRACGGDEALRKEVEALLNAGARAGSFLETPPGGFAQALIQELGDEDPSEESLVGSRVGPYRILELIGSGGMGAVYLAEREAPHKRVALKLVHPILGTGDVRRRFLNEREILAALEHPAIARLLDGGMTEEGLPYFVMEYVDGLPIDRYCDQHRIPIPERLALFRDVCRAVAYAHQNLVVHRDLKPSNILVTQDEHGRPQVKLLDFGIAKVLRPERVPHSVAVTRTQAGLMTPEYASPEQVQGANVTTASDVYVLGVLLYELLTGHRPYRSRSLLQHELARAVLEEDPMCPSTAVMRTEEITSDEGATETITPEDVGQARSTSVERLRRRLRGDLDNIVMKALRKEKEQRYASAEQLAEDVRRYLEGLPVKARKATTAYRARKFVRRHRIGIAAAALVVLSLAGGLGAALWQGRVAAAERDRAEWAALRARLEARKAERMMAFIISVFQGAGSNMRSGSVTARELLQQGAERVETELQDEPEMQAEMLEVLGQVHRSLVLYEEAIPLLERALSQQKRLYGAGHPEIASGLYELALLRQRIGHYDIAESLFQEALDLRRRLHGTNPHPDVAESLQGLAGLLHRKGRYAEAGPLYHEALRQWEALYGKNDAKVAKCWQSLGLLLHYKGEYAEAAEAFRKALAISQKAPEKEAPIVDALTHLAGVLSDLGAYHEAEPILRRTLSLWEDWYGGKHPRAATGMHRLAELLFRKGEYAEADSLYRKALAIRRDVHGDTHTSVAMTATRLADLLVETGAYAEADSLYQAALEATGVAFSEEHVRTSYVHLGLGRLRLKRGHLLKAEEHLREGLRISQQKLPEGHPETAVAKSLLGRCLAMLGQMEEASALLTEGYTVLEAKLGSEHPETQRVRQWMEDAWGPESEPAQVSGPAQAAATLENE